MFRTLQKRMNTSKTGTASITHLRLNIDFETTMSCHPSPSSSYASDDIKDDACSETSTLVDCDSPITNRITTAFQETDPEARAAIYQEYLARPYTVDEMDDQELDPYNTSWAYKPSKRSGVKRSSRGTRSDQNASQGKKGWHVHF